MASSALSGANLLDDDITAEDRLAGDAEASHGSLLDDEREADIGLEVQSDAGIMADMSAGDDADLEAIKARVREMEEEALKLKEMQTGIDNDIAATSPQRILDRSNSSNSLLNLSYEDKVEVDARSCYVGNVDYGATAEELEQHFHGCGSINRVTILCNKFDGNPKGFAYVEFTDKDSVDTAMALDDSLFRGRQIKVMPKRTNRPGITSTNRPPYSGGRGFQGNPRNYRGRSFRGRSSFGPIRNTRYRGRSSFYSPY